MCHTRVMPDGSVVKGAQGNFPFDKAMAFAIRSGAGDTIAIEPETGPAVVVHSLA